MAGREQFNSSYNYTYRHFTPNLPCPPQRDQPVFPMDFRQYREYRFQGNDQRDNPVNNTAGYFQSHNDYNIPVNNYNMYQSQEMAAQGGTSYHVESQPHSSMEETSAEMLNHDFHNNENVTNTLEASRKETNTEIIIQEDNCRYDYLLKEEDADISHIKSEEKCATDTDNELSKSNTDVNEVEVGKADILNDAEVIAKTTETDNVMDSSNGVIKIKEEVIDDATNDSVNTVVSCDDSDSTIIDESEMSKDTEETGNELDEQKKKIRKKKNNKSSIKNTRIKVTLKCSAEKKEFKCDVCQKVLLSIRALEKHGNLHTGKYSCKECGKICNSQTSLENHTKIHKGFVGSEVCKVCDKIFYDKSSLNKHTLSVHMGIKNFQCGHCELSFYAKKTYEEHVRVHTGERPFKCDLCPKTYKRISDLNHHVRLHKGEISHTCEFCGEGYRRSSELKRHMQKHNDSEMPVKPERQNVCEWCGIRFATMKALQKHITVHIESLEVQPARRNEDEFFTEKNKMVESIVHGLGGSGFSQGLASQSQTEAGFQRKPSPRELFARSEMMVANTNTVFECQSLGPLADNVQPKVSMTQEQSQDTGTVSHAPASVSVDNGITKVSVNTSEKSPEHVVNQSDGTKKIKPDRNKDIVSVVSNDVKNHSVKVKIENVDADTESDYSKGDYEYSNDENTEAVNDYGSDTEVEDDSYIPRDEDTSEEDSDYVPRKSSTGKPKKNAKDVRGKAKKKVKVGRKKRKSKGIEKGSEDENNDTKPVTKKKKRGDRSEEPSSYVCEECGKFFSRKECFNKHMNIHTGVFTCGLCSKSFASQLSLDTHMDNHEGRKLKTATCKVCDKRFYDGSSLNKHVKNVHMNFRPFACSDCDRKFSEKKTLVEHIRVHTGERPFACEICRQTFKRQSELNFHMKKHTGEVKLTCSQCGEGFRRPSELKTHTIIKHDGDKPFKCSVCGHGFMSNCLLQEHLLTHSNEKNFECEKCGKGFYSRAKLAKHNRIKSDCRKQPQKINGYYTCRFCLLQFLELANLNSHTKNVHEVEGTTKKYSCQVCYKEFGRRQALKRHLKIHAQIRDYKCSVCNAAFIQKHHLTQHERTHTGEKPYQCEVCLKSFAQSATLYSHIKHHF